jgi:hypothetical protein
MAQNSKLIYLSGNSSISVDRESINYNFLYLDKGFLNLSSRIKIVEDNTGVKDNLFTGNLELNSDRTHTLGAYTIRFGNSLVLGDNSIKSFTTPSEDDDLITLSYFNIALEDKQDELVSGTNIKTINGESILGNGDFVLPPPTFENLTGDVFDNLALETLFNSKQDELVSGTNIKTINGEPILGSGDFVLPPPTFENLTGDVFDNLALETLFNSKQDELVSGTNIKTINGEPILGSGDFVLPPPTFENLTGDVFDNLALETLFNSKQDNLFIINGIETTPLTQRTTIRLEEFLEAVDDNVNGETIFRINPNTLVGFTSNSIIEVGSSLEVVGIPNNFAYFDSDGFLSIRKLINTPNRTLLSDVNGDVQEVEIFNLNDFQDLLTATNVNQNGEILAKDFFNVIKGIQAGFKITDIIIENTTNNLVTINIGSSEGLDDVAQEVVIPANGLVDVPLGKKIFSKTLEILLWINSSNWNGASLTISINTKKTF